LIAVWDGKSEASKDLDVRLVKHMVDLMRDPGGMIEPINPAKLTRTLKPNSSLDENPIPVMPIKKNLSTSSTSTKKTPIRKNK
jgi:hypothetical protein